MSKWERFIRTTGILTILLSVIPLYVALMAWTQVFTPGVGNIDHTQDWVGAFSPVFYTVLLISLGIGLIQQRAWSAWCWIIIILLSFPTSSILGYGLFDGGPPYPYPTWLGSTIAVSPIIVSAIIWLFLIAAFRKLGKLTESITALRTDKALIGLVVSLLLIGAIWFWLKDRNTISMSPEISLYEHQTSGFSTDPYILRVTQSQKVKITIINMNSVDPLTVNFMNGCQDMTVTLLNSKNEAVGQAVKAESQNIACTQALTTKVLAPQEKVQQELVLTISDPKAGWHAIRVHYGDYVNTAPVRLSGK